MAIPEEVASVSAGISYFSRTCTSNCFTNGCCSSVEQTVVVTIFCITADGLFHTLSYIVLSVVS